MNTLITPLTIAAALGSGLVAGLFFTFSTFVMKALGQVAPANGIKAMQAINRNVMNPLTMGVFMGTAVLGAASVVYAVFNWPQPGSAPLLAGGLLYLGSFVVTAAGNVPMNDALASMDASTGTTVDYWKHYLSRWSFWNHVRTIAACLAMAAYILAARVMPA